MQALVDIQTQVKHIVSWQGDPLTPVYETYPNSARICEVSENAFKVALPLFWVNCADDVVADRYWYDTATNLISAVENAPKP